MSDLPIPSQPISDTDREIAVRLVKQALVRGEVEFEELDHRFGAIYSASTRGELDAVTEDLPLPPPPLTPPRAHPVAGTGFSLFSDLKRGGYLEVDGNLSYFAVFGNVTLDLSESMLRDGASILMISIFGGTTVILPDGVRVNRTAVAIFGDQKEDLSPPVPRAPTVRVAGFSLFGDTKIYSLSRVPEGRLQRWWRQLRAG